MPPSSLMRLHRTHVRIRRPSAAALDCELLLWETSPASQIFLSPPGAVLRSTLESVVHNPDRCRRGLNIGRDPKIEGLTASVSKIFEQWPATPWAP